MPDSQKVPPLLSSKADRPELEQTIDAFVLGLAERVDLLQDAEAAGDLPQVAQRATALARAAAEAGFEPLARGAEALLSAARAEKADEARRRLVALTLLAQRVRLGHRGAL